MKIPVGLIRFALASIVVAATLQSSMTPIQAQSTIPPQIIVDVIRRIDALSRPGGYGYHEQSGIVQTGDVVNDHIHIRNTGNSRVAEIWLRGSLPFSNLEEVGWTAVGANSQSWEAQVYMQDGHYILRFAPDGGIEPGGVGEYVFLYKVGNAPLNTTTLTHAVIQIVSIADQRPIADDYTSAIWMSSR